MNKNDTSDKENKLSKKCFLNRNLRKNKMQRSKYHMISHELLSTCQYGIRHDNIDGADE